MLQFFVTPVHKMVLLASPSHGVREIIKPVLFLTALIKDVVNQWSSSWQVLHEFFVLFPRLHPLLPVTAPIKPKKYKGESGGTTRNRCTCPETWNKPFHFCCLLWLDLQVQKQALAKLHITRRGNCCEPKWIILLFQMRPFRLIFVMILCVTAQPKMNEFLCHQVFRDDLFDNRFGWNSSKCALHLYDPGDVVDCLDQLTSLQLEKKQLHFAFVGDSRIRVAFLSFWPVICTT